MDDAAFLGVVVGYAVPLVCDFLAASVGGCCNGKVCEPVRGASLVGSGADVIQKIDMVGTELDLGQGMCGSSSGSIPTNVGQPMIRVSSITVGGR